MVLSIINTDYFYFSILLFVVVYQYIGIIWTRSHYLNQTHRRKSNTYSFGTSAIPSSEIENHRVESVCLQMPEVVTLLAISCLFVENNFPLTLQLSPKLKSGWNLIFKMYLHFNLHKQFAIDARLCPSHWLARLLCLKVLNRHSSLNIQKF